MNYNNYSGGAKGSDIAWEIVGKKYGVKTTSFSFKEHNSLSSNRMILSDEELLEGWERVLVSAKKMNRYIENTSPYVRKLLSRNWFQVKNSDAIFAIGTIVYPNKKGSKQTNKTNIPVVDGGTGYAVHMAMEVGKLIFVFEQNLNKWFKWENDNFIEIEEPILTKNFAGIGTRELTDNGINAIKSIYEKTFKE